MTPVLGIIASSNQQGRAGGPVGAYEPIGVAVVPSGGLSSITFGSIPQTYTHLQIRVLAQTNRSTYGRDSLQCRVNGDSGNNYSGHYLFGDGSSTGSGGSASQALFGFGTIGASAGGTLNNFGIAVADFFDYANTSKYKTVRSLAGTDMNGTGTGGIGGLVELSSGAWYNTAAITSIVLTPGVGTLFNQYSSFALYGIKG